MREKKKWQNPELIVLVRGKPEETVLTGCKAVVAGVVPDNTAGNCSSGTVACTACYDPAAS